MSFKNNTPPSSSSAAAAAAVSLKLTFPCTDCNFEAQSARQLSRHKAVTHTRNALKCVLCPFVTAYQTNLLRHRKDVHGICGSKGNKSCKFCGFVSEDNDTLIQHQIEIHRDILKSAQAKFAKELLSAGGEECIAEFSANFESMNEDLFNKNPSSSLLQLPTLELQQLVKKKAKSTSKKSSQSLIVSHDRKINHQNNNGNVKDDERTEFEEFWKAGFIDQYGDHGQYFVQAPILKSLMRNNHNTPATSQAMNDLQNESVHTSSRSSTPKSQLSSANVINMGNKAKSKKKNKIKNLNNHNHKPSNLNLPATRIRRQYNCNDCGFRTINPREFLYHRRDMHGYKVKIVECPYCVYACQYVQKLQRHLLLVHKLTSVMNSPSDASNANNTSNNIDCDLERILQKRKYRKSQSIIANNNNNNNNNDINHGNIDIMDDVDDADLDDEGDVGDCNNEEDEDEEDDDEIANPNNGDEDVDDDQQSINDPEFEQMKSFEMNLDDYSQNDEMEIDSNNANDDKKFLFNLECFICKIKFADAISAQKHFMKHHKHSNVKNNNNVNNNNNSLMSLMIKNVSTNSWTHSASAGMVTANQKKIFDNDAKNIHVCNYCGYKTRWLSELERHIRVHSKEKPFKCPFCDFRSKWKGDLNRHIQRYHSGEPTLPDLESDNSVNSYMANNDDEMSPQDETMNESFMNDFSDNVDNQNRSNPIDLENDDINSDQADDENMPTFNGSSAKMYKCTYCDFVCSTASRFHVHYVQHLNTKPFQCSICGHRSNWEWDVTKHIKMKAQRDPGHTKARPVLIHDSGKRDYSKYDKFVVWVGRDEAELVVNDISKIDFRAKRFKNETEDGELNDDDDYDNDGGVPNSGMDSLLTPEVCFEVDGEEINDGHFSNEPIYNMLVKEGMIPPSSSSKKRSVVKSAIVSRHPNSRTKILKCFQCEFSHKFARVMVAHISSHTEQKPYYCGQCLFETNWREVIINHCVQMHDCDSNDFEMHFRCLIDENGICRIVSDEELKQLIEEQQATNNMMNGSHNQSNKMALVATPMTVENALVQSSLIEPNIYEEKAVIRCDHCPFITTNMKKMSIHYRFHNKSKGSLCCKYCPYYVNNRDKLIRHQKLHQTSYKMDLVNNTANDINLNDNPDFPSKKFKPSKLISCSQCPFQTSNAKILGEHINTHHSNRMVKSHHIDAGGYLINDSILEQSLLTENEELFDVNPQDSPDNDLFANNDNNEYGNDNSGNGGGENSVSLVNFNNMKNGNGKKFSYVCRECPAAFKSPGDCKKHAIFHSSNHPHSCPYCTYNAKNKPQLCKHLYVHTEEYVAKRANSYPNGTKHLIENQNADGGNLAINTDSSKKIGKSNYPAIMSKQNCGNKILKQKMHSNHIGSNGKKTHRKNRTKVEFPMKPVKVKLNSEENGKQNIVFNNTDLMASQEFLETKEYLQRINSGIKNRCMYRCSKCPAVFTKVNTLIYHMTLHEQMARFSCDNCSYSTEMEDNLGIHSLLHNLTESQTALGYNFNYNCHKCPAGFSKRTRLEKHLSLHGAKYNWKCNKCDYSVRYAATLVKHRALHLINPDFQAIEYDDKDGIILPNEIGDAKASLNDSDHVEEKQFGKNDLKFKLNLAKLKENLANDEANINHEEDMPLAVHLNPSDEEEDLEENSNLEENASLSSPPDDDENDEEGDEDEDEDEDVPGVDDEEVDEDDDDDDDDGDGDGDGDGDDVVVDQEVCLNNDVSIPDPVLSLTTDGDGD